MPLSNVPISGVSSNCKASIESYLEALKSFKMSDFYNGISGFLLVKGHCCNEELQYGVILLLRKAYIEYIGLIGIIVKGYEM